MNCQFIDDGKRTWRVVHCARCGRKVKSPYGPDRIYAECRAWPRTWEWGHWTEFGLAVLGFNQQRFNAIRRYFGFVKPCKCGQRIARLNASGGWFRDRVDVLTALLRKLRF